jgi:hypothetical protein
MSAIYAAQHPASVTGVARSSSRGSTPSMGRRRRKLIGRFASSCHGTMILSGLLIVCTADQPDRRRLDIARSARPGGAAGCSRDMPIAQLDLADRAFRSLRDFCEQHSVGYGLGVPYSFTVADRMNAAQPIPFPLTGNVANSLTPNVVQQRRAVLHQVGFALSEIRSGTTFATRARRTRRRVLCI